MRMYWLAVLLASQFSLLALQQPHWGTLAIPILAVRFTLKRALECSLQS